MMPQPGIEPGSYDFQSCILPLDYRGSYKTDIHKFLIVEAKRINTCIKFKMQLIQKSSKILFLDIFISFNRVQRALQE